MRRFALPTITILGALTALVLSAAPANAQATRTWVSGVGDDVNPCSRTAPCKTFAGAISKTAINGEINCLDPGGFGAVTITKSMTIDCHEVFASILASGTTGVVINMVTGGDVLQTARLRNININGSGSAARSGIRGINVILAKHVFLEDMLITQFLNEGVRDARTNSGGHLYIKNSIIRDNAGTGVAVAAAPASFVNAVIDNSQLELNSNGVAVGSTNQVIVNRSEISGNTTGVEADAGGVLSVNGSVISSNTTGVSAGGTVRLSNNDIAFNGTGISGATTSFGNNRIYPNVGTTPTPASPGQQ
jgi:hypothetical protein